MAHAGRALLATCKRPAGCAPGSTQPAASCSLDEKLARSWRTYDICMVVLFYVCNSLFHLPTLLEATHCSLPALPLDVEFQSFPCGGSKLHQAAWAISVSPLSVWRVCLRHGLYSYMGFVLMQLSIATVALAAPGFYIRKGRHYLIAMSRLCYRTTSIYDLLTRPDDIWVVTFTAGCFYRWRGLFSLWWDTFCAPLPMSQHLPLHTVCGGLLVIHQLLVQGPLHTPWPHVVLTCLVQVAFGVALPTVIMAASERGVRAQLRAQPPAPPASATPPWLYTRKRSQPTAFVSYKISSHEAYEDRQRILPDVVEVVKAASYEPPLASVSALALRGCLQLLMWVADPTAGVPQQVASQEGAQQLLEGLRDVLPERYRQDGRQYCVNVQAGGRCVSLGGSAAAGGGDAAAADGAEAGRGDAGVAEFGEVAAVRVEPVVVRAGGVDVQEVAVRVRVEEGAEGGAARVVVGAWARGELVAVEAQLETAPGGEVLARVTLPPGLDPRPIAIYLISADPPTAGRLLGTATTLALPPAAAQEFVAFAACHLAAHPSAPASFAALASDLATAWQLGRTATPPLTPHHTALLKDLFFFFEANSLRHCTDALRAATLSPYTPTPPCSSTPTRAATPLPVSPASSSSSLSSSVVHPLETFTMWRMRQGRRADRAAACLFFVICLFGSLRIRDAEAWGAAGVAPALRRHFAIVLHMLCVAVPFAALSRAGPRLRLLRFPPLVFAQAAVKGALYIGGCWLPALRPEWTICRNWLHCFLISGILRPCFNQASVPVQVLATASEELCKLFLMAAVSCGAPAPGWHRNCRLTDVHMWALIVAASALTSWAAGRRAHNTFARQQQLQSQRKQE